jgi:O-antigen/teichoic acid export membrane protein
MLSMSGLSLYRNLVQFGMNIAVAAFVGPADYGLIVFTTPFIVLVSMLTDLGMASAITRAPSLSREEAGAAMGAMVAGGAACAALLMAAAHPLEAAIGMVGLAPVMIAMAGIVVLGIAAAVPRAMLERELLYGRVAATEAAAIAIGAGVGIAAAWNGAGIWSLIGYNLVVQLVRVGAFAWAARGRVSPNLRLGRLGALLSFGGWVLATNLLSFAARNGDNLLIGAWLGAGALGVYGLAYQFMLAPLMAITWPTSSILLATLRGEDPHGERARAVVEAVMSVTALAVFPAMVFLTFGLRFPVEAVLSERWRAVPGIVAWLAPAGAVQAIASYNGAILMVAGRARAQFALTVVNTVVLLATFVLSLPFGLMALVRAYTTATVVLSGGFLALIVALTSVTWRRLLRTLAPALLATGAGVGATAATVGLTPGSWLSWIAATAVYAATVLATYAVCHVHVRRTLATLRAPSLQPAT